MANRSVVYGQQQFDYLNRDTEENTRSPRAIDLGPCDDDAPVGRGSKHCTFVVIVIVLLVVTEPIWDHVARINDSRFRSAAMFAFVMQGIAAALAYVGNKTEMLSGYLEINPRYLRLEEIGQTARERVELIVWIISWILSLPKQYFYRLITLERPFVSVLETTVYVYLIYCLWEYIIGSIVWLKKKATEFCQSPAQARRMKVTENHPE